MSFNPFTNLRKNIYQFTPNEFEIYYNDRNKHPGFPYNFNIVKEANHKEKKKPVPKKKAEKPRDTENKFFSFTIKNNTVFQNFNQTNKAVYKNNDNLKKSYPFNKYSPIGLPNVRSNLFNLPNYQLNQSNIPVQNNNKKSLIYSKHNKLKELLQVMRNKLGENFTAHHKKACELAFNRGFPQVYKIIRESSEVHITINSIYKDFRNKGQAIKRKKKRKRKTKTIKKKTPKQIIPLKELLQSMRNKLGESFTAQHKNACEIAFGRGFYQVYKITRGSPEVHITINSIYKDFLNKGQIIKRKKKRKKIEQKTFKKMILEKEPNIFSYFWEFFKKNLLEKNIVLNNNQIVPNNSQYILSRQDVVKVRNACYLSFFHIGNCVFKTMLTESDFASDFRGENEDIGKIIREECIKVLTENKENKIFASVLQKEKEILAERAKRPPRKKRKRRRPNRKLPKLRNDNNNYSDNEDFDYQPSKKRKKYPLRNKASNQNQTPKNNVANSNIEKNNIPTYNSPPVVSNNSSSFFKQSDTSVTQIPNNIFIKFENYKKLINENPKLYTAWYDLGNLYKSTKQNNYAITCYKEVLQLCHTQNSFCWSSFERQDYYERAENAISELNGNETNLPANSIDRKV